MLLTAPPNCVDKLCESRLPYKIGVRGTLNWSALIHAAVDFIVIAVVISDTICHNEITASFTCRA